MSEPFAVRVPQMNPNDEQAIVVRWHVEQGAYVRAGETLVTLETTKTAFDVDAPRDGYALYEHGPRDEIAVGAPVAWIADTKEAARIPRPEPRRAAGTPARGPAGRFTRKALKLMKERGLGEADFPGDERVDAEAVERAATGSGTRRAKPGRSDAKPLDLPPSKAAEIHALQSAREGAIPSTVAVALDCVALEARLAREAEAHGPVSVLELCIYETARELPAWPALNGFHADGAAWTYDHVGIGFAVNLGRALRVPVVEHAGNATLRETARAVRELSLRYMRDELTIDDVAGGTFTITDLSGEGVVSFVPVLNERQAAILGLTAERPQARTRDLILTFDHRMSDGMEAARFLAALRDRLEARAE